MTPLTLSEIARVCHEASRALQAVYNNLSNPVSEPWDDLPIGEQKVVINGVSHAIGGRTPAQLHEEWVAAKRAAGWIYGPVKNPEMKTHPCLVDYEELPAQERVKDQMFHAIIRSLTVGERALLAFYGEPGILPRRPKVGDHVHYVSYGTPGGEYGRECRAAVITEIRRPDPMAVAEIGLCVLNPAGVFFDRDVVHDSGTAMTLPHPGATETASGHTVLCGGRSYRGGTWHWAAGQ